MTRQLLLNEIDRLYTEKKKKKNLDENYIFNKYPKIASLFEEYRFPTESWRQLAREVLLYGRDYLFYDLTYMYNRTMQIIRRFGKNASLYFEIKVESGTYTLPDRLSDLNRLFQLYTELFSQIYPLIINSIIFDIHVQEKNSRILSGKIIWPKTLRSSMSKGTMMTPLIVSKLTQESIFETPENILFILSILRLKRDANYLLQYDFKDPLTIKEKMILKKDFRWLCKDFTRINSERINPYSVKISFS